MEHDSWAIPSGASSAYLKSGVAIASTGGATVVSSFAHQPDYPRNIVLTPTGTTSSTQTGTAVVTGHNIFGKVISENFSVVSNSASALTGSAAFKDLTSVSWPQASGSGATFKVDMGIKLGALHCSNQAGQYVFSQFNNAFETTRGVFGVDATHVELNTFSPNGSMDATKPADFYYIQNYRCFPN